MAKELPISFVEQMKPRLQSEYALFEASLFTEPPVSVRLNSRKSEVTDCDEKFSPVATETVPWCSMGRYLNRRPLFTLDPLFHAGAYYVQEASSMFLQRVVEQYLPHDAVALDLCAAPGGKSIVLSDWLTNGFLVSNEIIPNRCAILAENLVKWGNPRSAVTNNAPVAFEKLPQLFDAVLVDVPCSGEGMFRKDETAIEEWSPANVANCVTRGREILESALVTLKDGGLLIYSTCTFNEQEDEQQVEWLIEQGCELLKVDIDAQWNIEETNGYHFWPHRVKGEGLFMAVLRKQGEDSKSKPLKVRKSIFSKAPKEVITAVVGETFAFANHNNIWRAVPQTFSWLVDSLLSCTKVVHWGVDVMEEKGKSFIPQQGLATSFVLNREAFPSVEIDRKTALHFLSAEAIVLDDAPKGHVLLTYKSAPLGFVKNIGSRCNNLYPNAWRIRMNWKDVDELGNQQ